MPATLIQNGNALDHIPTTDLALGAVVVLGSLVGIACRPIPANALGALALDGLFECDYATGTAASVGDTLYWDATAQKATTVATGNTRLGLCARAATTTDTTIRVLLGR